MIFIYSHRCQQHSIKQIEPCHACIPTYMCCVGVHVCVWVTALVVTGLFIGCLPSDWLQDRLKVHLDPLELTCRRAALVLCDTKKRNKTRTIKKTFCAESVIACKGKKRKAVVWHLPAYVNISKLVNVVFLVCVCVCVCVWHVRVHEYN